MKVVILAGGFGTRISEESAFKPKPMIEIGGMPILWHIMKTYSAYGYNEFVICAGYKQHVIKCNSFANNLTHFLLSLSVKYLIRALCSLCTSISLNRENTSPNTYRVG